MLDQLIGNDLHHIDGNGKPDALAAAGARGNGRVHSDHFALEIQQRPAAIAGIDRRIGLHEILEPHAFAQLQITPPFGADDAERDRVAQTKRAADGQHKVADVGFIAVADPRRSQARFVDLQHGNIGRRIRQHLLGVDLAAVGQLDFDAFRRGPFDHVPVGQHVKLAVVLDNCARAGFFHRFAAVAGRRIGMLRIDVHHGRLGHLHHFAQDVGLILQMDRFLGQFVVLLGTLGGGRHRLIALRGSKARAGTKKHGGKDDRTRKAWPNHW